jgi:hypothetical protein
MLLLTFIVPIAAGIGVGFATNSVAWGIIVWLLLGFIMAMYTIKSGIRGIGAGISAEFGRLIDNSTPTSIIDETLEDGRKKRTFGDGGVVMIDKDGGIVVINSTPQANAPGAWRRNLWV